MLVGVSALVPRCMEWQERLEDIHFASSLESKNFLASANHIPVGSRHRRNTSFESTKHTKLSPCTTR